MLHPASLNSLHVIGVLPRRINEIAHGKRAVTADTVIRLARALGTSEQFWTGLQLDHDLEEERKAAQNMRTPPFGMTLPY